MTDLLVDRLHARAVVAAGDEARVHALLSGLTGRGLAEALERAPVPDGYWCLRRLDVSLRLDPTPGDGAVTRRWAQTVTDALLASLSGADPNVAYFPRRTDAVTDLVASLALGRSDRRWAWRAVGVLTDTDPDPVGQLAETVLAVLGHHPAAAAHALSGATVRAGLPAVHRLLGADGWQRAAGLVLAASGQSPGRWLAADCPTPGPAVAQRVESIVASILGRSPFVVAWRRSRLRPTAGTARAWAVLAAAEAEPSLLRRTHAAAVLSLLPAAVDPGTAPAPEPPVRSDPPVRPAPVLDHAAVQEDTPVRPAAVEDDPLVRPAAVEDEAPVRPSPLPSDGVPASMNRSEPAAAHPGPRPAVPAPLPTAATPPGRPIVAGVERAGRPIVAGVERAGRGTSGGAPRPGRRSQEPPDAQPGQKPAPTVWGGLVYLLATADAAGIPDDLFSDRGLDGQPAPWLLFHLARLLTGRAANSLHDPAVRTLAGLPADADPPAPPPSARQRGQLDRHADRWARITAERMGAAQEEPRALVARIAARTGTVDSVPGWTELRLRLADVDVAVRRAGLDIDPGFVPWLGAVVVIRYE